MEIQPNPEQPIYQVRCQMCIWAYEGKEDDVFDEGNKHYVEAFRDGKIHQLWMGLKERKPEWIK